VSGLAVLYCPDPDPSICYQTYFDILSFSDGNIPFTVMRTLAGGPAFEGLGLTRLVLLANPWPALPPPRLVPPLPPPRLGLVLLLLPPRPPRLAVLPLAPPLCWFCCAAM
jgi:hypothetical protein